MWAARLVFNLGRDDNGKYEDTVPHKKSIEQGGTIKVPRRPTKQTPLTNFGPRIVGRFVNRCRCGFGGRCNVGMLLATSILGTGLDWLGIVPL